MTWASWSDFWNMGGYGFYVWGSYAVTLLCVAAEMVLVRGRHRAVLRRLQRTKYAAAKE